MGHVGILAGIAAVAIGFIIMFLIVPIFDRRNRGFVVLAGVFTMLLGHLGAITGAIYIGTAGVVLCYISGLWAIVVAALGFRQKQA